MNFKKYFLIGAVAAAALTACDTDKLEIDQPGVLILDDTYANATDSDVYGFLAAIYAEIFGDAYESVIVGGASCWNYMMYDLNIMGGECAEGFQYDEGAESTTYSRTWSYLYQTIAWCNNIIEYLPANETATASLVTQAIAEARAIRAIFMGYLVQLYGTPPLADHIMDGTEVNTPAEESWAWIEEELEAAADDLPTKSGLGGQSSIGGRITKEACYAYEGRFQLWQGNYSEAASTLYNKVISTGKYALYDDYADYNSSTSDFSDENIWEFDFNEGSDVATGQAGCFDLTCFSPDCVLMWWSTYASLYLVWGMGSYPSIEYVNFLTEHDGASSSRYNAQILDMCTASMMGYMSNPVSNCQGYMKVKDMCLEEDLVGTLPYTYSIRNKAYMRYSEVLLNYAEAVAMGGSAGSGLSGLEALNLVRNRAGLEDAPSLSMDDETYGIKAERRAELYCEGFRFIDLIRWGDAATELADCGKYTYLWTFNSDYVYEISDGVYMYFFGSYSETSTGGSGFKSGKNELFPIPATEINQNPSLTQNTGW